MYEFLGSTYDVRDTIDFKNRDWTDDERKVNKSSQHYRPTCS